MITGTIILIVFYTLIIITAIDSVTNGHLDHAARTIFSSWQDTKHYKYDLFVIVRDPKEMISTRSVSVQAMNM